MITINQAMRDRVANHMRSKPMNVLYPQAAKDVENGICPMEGCGKPVGEVKDKLELKEYSIGGMCSQCQDEIFS